MKRNALAISALVVSIAALVSARSNMPPLPAGQDIPEAGQKAARELSAAFNAVAEYVRPSVVQINVEKKAGANMRRRAPGRNGQPGPDVQPLDPRDLEEMLRRFFGEDAPNFRFEPQQVVPGTGSGFVFDDKGHVITNNHVVADAAEITVTLHDGTDLNATVVGTYPEADIAVIKVDSNGLRPLKIGTSRSLKVGDWVMAVGSPFGLSQTVTAGIVSATERENLGINQYESFIQTDASINPGNSGGPLVDMEGRAVGVNSAIATMTRSSAGVGFAIPIDMAARLADKLIEKGKIDPALMGIKINSLTPPLARQFGLDPKTEGVLVLDVVKDAPAAKAGLRSGDVITSFDNEPVRSNLGLKYLVETSDAGKTYPITYVRDGQTLKAQVSPAPSQAIEAAMRPERRARPAADAEEQAASETNDFGLAVTPLTRELAERYGYDNSQTGLVVTEVAPDSPAFDAGIEVGDLVTQYVKDRKILPAKTVAEFEDLVESNGEIAIFIEDVNHRLPGEFKTLAKEKAAKN
jgi:serine protease Do